ncbi:MAG: DpnI domain-containing protein [Paracoccaceae bacterium]|nr:DpnI domain-containing protein [Paracoccaceae bacterium]MDP7186723.1 DpnI domain-containing protein [Paracoccaceae bacterium]
MEPAQTEIKSESQKARILTEAWASNWLFCPECGHFELSQFKANRPVADFFCPSCFSQYELKSQKKPFGGKIVNGAYATKIERLNSDTSPNLILMHYDADALRVVNLTAIPKRYFVMEIVERRKPLAATARRAGWVGSNILIGRLPESARVQIVSNGVVRLKSDVIREWERNRFVAEQPQKSRGWLLDVLRCVENIGQSEFTIAQVYEFEGELSGLYPNNSNIRAKIRQQLQVLRDKGQIEFIGGGVYRRI